MDPENVIGVAGLSLAVVLGLSAYLYKRQSAGDASTDKLAMHFGMMVFGVVLVFSALLPQAIKNHKLSGRFTDSFNPFMLALFPLAIAAKLPGDRDLLRKLSGTAKDIIVAQISGLVSILLLYVVFLFQYAAASGLNDDGGLEAGFYVLATFYALALVALCFWLFDYPLPIVLDLGLSRFCGSPAKVQSRTPARPPPKPLTTPAPAAPVTFENIF